MDIGFRFNLIHKDNDFLKVGISAWNGGFGGTTIVYLGLGQLEETAVILKGFPNHPSDSREVLLGRFGPEWTGGAVSMRFYCADRSGHAYVEAKIESEILPDKPVQYVALTLPIEAAAMDSFVADLRRFEEPKIGIARLEGIVVTVHSQTH